MTEIEKLFENAGINKRCCANIIKLDDCICSPSDCRNYNYPDFTAEKQIKLIKWLIRNKRLFIRKADYSSNYYMDVTYNRGNGVDNPKFESCLASLINDIWQDLTDKEKEETRGILNEQE